MDLQLNSTKPRFLTKDVSHSKIFSDFSAAYLCVGVVSKVYSLKVYLSFLVCWASSLKAIHVLFHQHVHFFSDRFFYCNYCYKIQLQFIE
jgi:hypothetical protein